MTSFSKEFTKEDFLSIPEYGEKRDAPKDRSPFFLKSPGTLLKQKNQLLDILASLSKANTTSLQESAKTSETIKVKYFVRHKDGNISEVGGFIRLNTIIQDLLCNAALKVGDTDANGTLTIETEK